MAAQKAVVPIVTIGLGIGLVAGVGYAAKNVYGDKTETTQQVSQVKPSASDRQATPTPSDTPSPAGG